MTNWLLHNVVADLYGPYFLVFYAMAIVAMIVACYRSVRSVDRTHELAVPQVPVKLDPYEIAYLRGGETPLILENITATMILPGNRHE